MIHECQQWTSNPSINIPESAINKTPKHNFCQSSVIRMWICWSNKNIGIKPGSYLYLKFCTRHSICVEFLRIWIIWLRKVGKKYLTFWSRASSVWIIAAMTQLVSGWTDPFLTHPPSSLRARARSSCSRRRSSNRVRTSTLTRPWASTWASPTLGGPPTGRPLTSIVILTGRERGISSQVGLMS